MFGVEG